MDILKITENNIGDAGKIHSESWKESHKSFCSEGFVARHTEEAQTEYIRSEIAKGKDFYMLIVHIPVGIVSIYDNVIENFYIIPSEQRKGYGAILLQYVLKQCHGIPSLWILSNNVEPMLFIKNTVLLKAEKRNSSATIFLKSS